MDAERNSRCVGPVALYSGGMTTITLTASDGHTLAAHLAEPAGTATAGIVVIQEIFGVNSHIKEDADRFAAAGYLAIAPHMFDRVKRGVDIGYTPETIAEGRDYAMALKPEGIAADVIAAIAELRARDVTKVGIVGYCFGGTVSAMAAGNFDVDAAVSYYGGGVGDLVKGGMKPKVPMICHFGDRDVWIPGEVIESVAAAWPEVTVYRYDANHGFHCDHRADFDQASADLAQERTLAFFAEHLS